MRRPRRGGQLATLPHTPHPTTTSRAAAGYYLPHLNVTWETFYDEDPLGGIRNATAAALVLGGETCMWGETVRGDMGDDLCVTVWGGGREGG